MLPDPTPPSGQEGSPAHKIHAHEIAVAIRNSLKLGGSLLVTWSVALIVKLQIPAHLGPVRQGRFAFAESFATMFFTTIGLGLDTYVIKEAAVRPKHASDFIGGVFALRSLISVVLFAAMAATLWATGRPNEIQFAVAVFGGTQFFMAINATLATLLQATTHVGRLAVANVVAKFIWGAGLLLALHYGAPLWVVALPMLASELLRTSVLVPAARLVADLHYRIDVRAVKSVLIASLPYFVSAMAGIFGNNLALTALEFIRKDEREVGWFAACQNLGSLAMLLYPLLQWVVMPMLSRAKARSPEEMMLIVRRSLEGLVILIAPVTIFISAGSDIFVRAVFGEKYSPAATGLSILSLVFLLFYLSIVLASSLIIAGRSWSVTIISLGTIVLTGILVVIFVPLGRTVLGTGGECAGAAVAVITSEACVVFALLARFRYAPLDRRNVIAFVKTAVLSATTLIVDHLLHHLGAVRLVVDMVLYVALALAVRLVQPDDVRRVIRLLRSRRPPGQPPDGAQT